MLILADLGYLGIQRGGARAALPQERAVGQELTAQQKEENRICLKTEYSLKISLDDGRVYSVCVQGDTRGV
jgi:hypothetical protein